MIKFIKKHKLNFISYFLCAFAMALFTIISFNCKIYAYTIDNDGNLVGDNLYNQYIETQGTVYTKIEGSKLTIIGTTVNPYSESFLGDIYLEQGTYTVSLTNELNAFNYFQWYNANWTFDRVGSTVTIPTDGTYKLRIILNAEIEVNYQGYIMLNKGSEALEWEPYGVWYSETNYDTIDNLYNNALSQYNDLALGNNYGYWKYIDYVEFEESNNIIFVPNTQEQNEWSTNDLINNNILKIGGYFDTTSLTMEPYQSNYNEVDSYISFNAYTPSESFTMTFGHCIGCNVVINDENSNSFSYTISESNYLIDINLIRQNVPSFGLYIIEMYISPNNAEQNGIYFANNDYITAYNKGYNVATSNADRKYIPQITDLQNQINSFNDKIIELTNNINTLTALNTDLQNQINNSYSWQTLFFAFADTPFRVVSNVLGFELFGLNLFATFIGMITVFGVVYLLKKFL